eukprot:64665-Chlamydomonas_euryale.AAC.2
MPNKDESQSSKEQTQVENACVRESKQPKEPIQAPPSNAWPLRTCDCPSAPLLGAALFVVCARQGVAQDCSGWHLLGADALHASRHPTAFELLALFCAGMSVLGPLPETL